MNPSWFIFVNDVVSGPLSTEQVRTQLATGQLPANCFIWWKGQREWIPIANWESQLDSILTNSNHPSQKAIWYVDTGASQVGPLTQSELIDHLKTISDLSQAKLWAVGSQKWTSLFELYDIMELLGVSRRESERAPLMGTVAVTRSTDDPKGFVLQAASISIGGMGLKGSHDLRKGDQISLLIKSPELASNIHLKGEVAYVTKENYAGVRFHNVHPETHSIIFDYVKRFNNDAAHAGAA